MGDSKVFNVLDLFCGAGGMAEGFLQAGFNIPVASDYSTEAAMTYQNRRKQLKLDHTFFQGDIKELTKKKKILELIKDTTIDIVVGGPPCQGFSLTGRRKLDDPRNKLFIEYLKIIKLVKPKYFIMENVRGILSFRINKIKGISGREYNDELVTSILKEEAFHMGYDVKWELLNAKDYGVPQNRPRVIFLGYQIKKKNCKIYNSVTIPNHPIAVPQITNVEDAISDLSFLKSGEKKVLYNENKNLSRYQRMLREGQTPNKVGETEKSSQIFNHEASKHGETTKNRFRMLNQGEKISGLLKRLTKEEFDTYKTKKRSCVKLTNNGISPTVLTLPDDIIHYDPENPRILTVRELARLQSFDDSFEFLGKRTTGGERRVLETPQYTQVGNAVPPFFAKAIATEIMIALKTPIDSKELIITLNK